MDMASHRMPAELIIMVIEAAVKMGHSLASFAATSREWQSPVEKYTFAAIRLTPPRIGDLLAMTRRNRARVRYFWLCLELEPYNFAASDPRDDLLFGLDAGNYELIVSAFQHLFSILSNWGPAPIGGLTLDISVYSMSDVAHWFEYPKFEPDLGFLPHEYQWALDEPVVLSQAGTSSISNIFETYLPKGAVRKASALIADFDKEMDEDYEGDQRWMKLPMAPIVTRLLLRQQTRRRWRPEALEEMLTRLPELLELHYEPWRAWDDLEQADTDQGKHNTPASFCGCH